MAFDNVKDALDCAMSKVLDAEEIFEKVLKENRDLREQVSNCKVEIGRLEALLADKKLEGECEYDYNCECCKCREAADGESEPTLKDLYELGKYLVDTVDEIESIHIQVVRTRKKEDDDEE